VDNAIALEITARDVFNTTPSQLYKCSALDGRMLVEQRFNLIQIIFFAMSSNDPFHFSPAKPNSALLVENPKSPV
jgi:hypothetical protein